MRIPEYFIKISTQIRVMTIQKLTIHTYFVLTISREKIYTFSIRINVEVLYIISEMQDPRSVSNRVTSNLHKYGFSNLERKIRTVNTFSPPFE